jgi:hypothetical protein
MGSTWRNSVQCVELKRMIAPKRIRTAPASAPSREESLFCCGSASVPDVDSLGISAADIRYARIPDPPMNTERTHMTRTSVASMSKYLPMPPHTPNIMRSVRERNTLRGEAPGEKWLLSCGGMPAIDSLLWIVGSEVYEKYKKKQCILP